MEKKIKIDFPSPELSGAGSRSRNLCWFPLSRYCPTPPAYHCNLHWFFKQNIMGVLNLSIIMDFFNGYIQLPCFDPARGVKAAVYFFPLSFHKGRDRVWVMDIYCCLIDTPALFFSLQVCFSAFQALHDSCDALALLPVLKGVSQQACDCHPRLQK